MDWEEVGPLRRTHSPPTWVPSPCTFSHLCHWPLCDLDLCFDELFWNNGIEVLTYCLSLQISTVTLTNFMVIEAMSLKLIICIILHQEFHFNLTLTYFLFCFRYLMSYFNHHLFDTCLAPFQVSNLRDHLTVVVLNALAYVWQTKISLQKRVLKSFIMVYIVCYSISPFSVRTLKTVE